MRSASSPAGWSASARPPQCGADHTWLQPHPGPWDLCRGGPGPSCREGPSASQAPSPPPRLPQRKSVGLLEPRLGAPSPGPGRERNLGPNSGRGLDGWGRSRVPRRQSWGPTGWAPVLLLGCWLGPGSSWSWVAGARPDTGRGRCSVCPWLAGRRVSSQWQGRGPRAAGLPRRAVTRAWGHRGWRWVLEGRELRLKGLEMVLVAAPKDPESCGLSCLATSGEDIWAQAALGDEVRGVPWGRVAAGSMSTACAAPATEKGPRQIPANQMNAASTAPAPPSAATGVLRARAPRHRAGRASR